MSQNVKVVMNFGTDGGVQIETIENGGMGTCSKIADQVMAAADGEADDKSRRRTQDYYRTVTSTPITRIDVK